MASTLKFGPKRADINVCLCCHAATNVNRRALVCPNDDADVVRVRQPTWEREGMADIHYVICSIPGKGLRQSMPYVRLPTHLTNISEKVQKKKGQIAERKREQNINAPTHQ
jgi:hypothetical protein